MAELLLNLMAGPAPGQPPGNNNDGGQSSSSSFSMRIPSSSTTTPSTSVMAKKLPQTLSNQHQISSILPTPNVSTMFSTGSIGIMPDLSHLSDAERPIIESVILRQKQEELEEAQLLKRKQDEVLLLEQSILRKRNEEQLGRRDCSDLDATCQICLKTKFADGVGHICQYCNIRCCSRCGFKIFLRSGKNIWACILCRKKQELLIKTGQWIHSSMPSKQISEQQTPSEIITAPETNSTRLFERLLHLGSSETRTNPITGFFRRNSLGMLMPSSFSSSSTHQQDSQDTTKTIASKSTTVQQQHLTRRKHMLPRQPSLPLSHQLPAAAAASVTETYPLQQHFHQKNPLDTTIYKQSGQFAMQQKHCSLTGLERRKLPAQRQKSRELPSLEDVVNFQQQQQQTSSQNQQQHKSQSSSKLQLQSLPSVTTSPKKSLPQLPRRTTSMSLVPATPSITSTSTVPSNSQVVDNSKQLSSSSISLTATSQPGTIPKLSCQVAGYSRSYSGGESNLPQTSSSASASRANLPGSILQQGQQQRLFLSAGSLVRMDSVGSDPGDIRRKTPPPSTNVIGTGRQLPNTSNLYSAQRPRLRDHLKMNPVYHRSFGSSSEDITDTGGAGVRSITPELSTEDDFDLLDSLESSGIGGGLSEQKILPQPRRGRALPRTSGNSLKTADDILDSKMKSFLAHPITWEKSEDGTQMIGRMILKKNLLPDSGLSSSAMLGMKVVGGRVVESGRLGAIIEKVKKGSISDTIGRLRPRDELLEWNGISLKGKTYDEVHDIIADSKHHSEIELVVARPLIDSTTTAAAATKKLSRHPLVQTAATTARDDAHNNRFGRRHTDVVSAQPRSLDIVVDKNSFFTRGSSLGAEFSAKHMRTTPYVKVTRTPTITGRVQVKLYYDGQTLELFVTIMNAIDLSPRKTGLLRNPYCTLYLLPDQTTKTFRKTSTVINSLEPVWNQTFQYSPLSNDDLRTKALELTICDYDHFLSNEFLGATIIELNNAQLDDESDWYILSPREDLQQQWTKNYYKLIGTSTAEISTGTTSGVVATATAGSGLSPPTHSAHTSISARLSDSDVASELSMDDFDSKADSWRCLLADANQTSDGSNSSSPLVMATDLRSGSLSTSNILAATAGSVGTPFHHQSHRLHHQQHRPCSSTGIFSHSGPTTSIHHHSRGHHHQYQYQTGSNLTTNQYGIGPRYRQLPSLTTISSNNYPNVSISGSQIDSSGLGIDPLGSKTTMLPPSDHHLMRPEFRKSSSQPSNASTKTLTQQQPIHPRSFSPPTVIGAQANYLPTSSITTMPPTGSIQTNNKRQLPFVPSMPHLTMNSQFGGSSRSLVTSVQQQPYSYGQHLQQQKSDLMNFDQQTLSGMYSDSEITIRPVFGNRPLYAHPVQPNLPTSRRFHRDPASMLQQHQQAASMDDLDYYHQKQQQQQQQPLQQQPQQFFRRTSSSLAYHHRPSLITSSSIDYRELKDYSGHGGSYQGDEADGEEEETEFDDDVDGSYKNHRHRYHHRKESAQSSSSMSGQVIARESVGVGSNGNASGGSGHHRSSIHRRNSRRKREQQQQQHRDSDDEETESSSTAAGNNRSSQNNHHRSHHHHHHHQKQPSQSQQQQQQQQQQQRDSFDLMNQQLPLLSQQQPSGALLPQPTARPKGSRTLSEFTGHRGQQFSAPEHPPHPSRNSLAVARSLSERSKEDKNLESSFSDVPTGNSMADQIDKMMEQLNANCDFSIDDLFATSSSTLNAPQVGPDGKPIKNKKQQQSGLTKKSQSASQLSVSGTKKRLGFRKNKQATSFSVHRSEEVLPDEVRHLVKQYSSLSSDGEGSISGESSSLTAPWMPQQSRPSQSSGVGGSSGKGEFSNFVEGLGPGQIVGRQALAASNLGDIQLSLHDRKGNLEVEVIRARGLQSNKSAKIIPAPFVKVYLFRNGKCISKAKTQIARRTYDPLFQQQLLFTDNYKGCILHVVVNGLYGRMDKKSFMGVVQIVLDDLDLSNIVIGWFKLFSESSAISLPTQQSSTKNGGTGSGGGGGGGSISGGASLMSASMDSFS